MQGSSQISELEFLLLLHVSRFPMSRLPFFASAIRSQGWQSVVLQLYGALFLPVLLGLGIGLNLIGWTAAHINIPLVFYFDTRHHIDMLEYLEIPAFLMCSLCYCFWLSFTITSSFISPQVWPLVWIIGFIILLFNPLLIFYHHARWWLIRSTFRVFTAGLVKVEVRQPSSHQAVSLSVCYIC